MSIVNKCSFSLKSGTAGIKVKLMAKPLFSRIRSHYESVAATLRTAANAASVFANNSDVGQTREKAYLEFLRQSVPYKCNVFLGGFLFDHNGHESKQIDVIVTTDTVPRYFLPVGSDQKSFSPIEGVLAVVSIKSALTKEQLFDALDGVASVPLMTSLEGRVNPVLKIRDYENWPVKIVYSSSPGVSPETLLSHVNQYYSERAHIPSCRKADFIHVAGSCLIIKITPGMKSVHKTTGVATELSVGSYHLLTEDCDLQAILWVLNRVQECAVASNQIIYNYSWVIDKVNQAD
jgi:hypothetical protein